ncbi:hypothetical protein PR048_017108 [Dryococelus australis]|uniref:Uncharacterized protein n=1 Tax=Dryococelus australis TaxID=614101 RepID=A0ABQ9H8L2_9NEOP|nr:hypothetical protein PR048_017108 [Dryococelus australis]
MMRGGKMRGRSREEGGVWPRRCALREKLGLWRIFESVPKSIARYTSVLLRRHPTEDMGAAKAARGTLSLFLPGSLVHMAFKSPSALGYCKSLEAPPPLFFFRKDGEEPGVRKVPLSLSPSPPRSSNRRAQFLAGEHRELYSRAAGNCTQESVGPLAEVTTLRQVEFHYRGTGFAKGKGDFPRNIPPSAVRLPRRLWRWSHCLNCAQESVGTPLEWIGTMAKNDYELFITWQKSKREFRDDLKKIRLQLHCNLEILEIQYDTEIAVAKLSTATSLSGILWDANKVPAYLQLLPASETEKCGNNKGDLVTRFKCTIDAKRKSLNWRAVFPSHCVSTDPDAGRQRTPTLAEEVMEQICAMEPILGMFVLFIDEASYNRLWTIQSIQPILWPDKNLQASFIRSPQQTFAVGTWAGITGNNLIGLNILPLRLIGKQEAVVAQRLARSPPIRANRAQSPAGSQDFRKCESCRTIPLVGGSSLGSPVSPAPSFRRRSIAYSLQSPSSTLENSLLRATQISSLQPCTVIDIAVLGHLYCKVKIQVLDELFTDLVLGHNIIRKYSHFKVSLGDKLGAATVAELLASHLGEPGSIPSRDTTGFSQVGIVPDDAAGQWVFSRISHFPRPCIRVLLYSHLITPSSALKTS